MLCGHQSWQRYLVQLEMFSVWWMMHGALLYRIPRTKGSTWEQILDQYTRYVQQRYGKAVVTFDEYSDGLSTKDSSHLDEELEKLEQWCILLQT